MEKYITSIKDLVYDVLADQIADDEPMYNFQYGMVHLLGINTSIDFKKASQFLGKPSLKNDPDANCLLGFIEECQGNYSSAFKNYALAVENSDEKNVLSCLQKVSKGRDGLQKTFSKLKLPLALNEKITSILSDCNKGTAKSKFNSKIIASYICEEESFCLETAQELFEAGDIYSAKMLLQIGNVDDSHDLYSKINGLAKDSIDIIKSSKGTLVELEGESILPNYKKSLSIERIKKECDDCSKICCQEWISGNKTMIDKMVKSQKRIIAKEQTQKKENRFTFLITFPLMIFGALWIFGSFTLAASVVFLYYCLCAFMMNK